ncbi:MAG: phosphatase PAP2 family protein [Candidatus Woykebacteria bacterium]
MDFIRANKAASWLFLGFLTALLLLTALVAVGETETFDYNALSYVTNIDSYPLSWFMIFISSFGDGFFPIIFFFAFAFALLLKGYKRQSYFSFLTWIGPLISFILKIVVARPRPEGFLDANYFLLADFGYPSGHVVFYTVFFGLVFLYALSLPKIARFGRILLSAVSLSLIFLIGFSRIFLGVHYPTDVIGGYLLGFIVWFMLAIAYKKFIYLE